jgi:hypothetical protein
MTPVDGSLIRLVFQGGEDVMTGVVRYLDERVNYIFSSESDTDSLIQVGRRMSDRVAQESSGAVVMAMNIGMAGWLIHEAVGPNQGTFFKFEGKKIPLSSSRVGLIQLGEGYSRDNVSSLERIETLVHEGRHSDCTGGLSQSALEGLRLGILPSERACGHTHVACPEGHPLAGLMACDDHPWGAYTVGAVFSIMMSRSCENCTESEKQMAELSALDSLSRVDETIMEGSLNGEYGAPDMSSQGVRE